MAHRPAGALVVAIDGPSGSGKSTVARGVASALDLRYLDTGAMYRALTWLVLERGVAPDDERSVTDLGVNARLEISTEAAPATVAVDGVDVTTAIRSAVVTAAVSAVSAHRGVRSAMVARQRRLIGDGGIVVEGRDIGTTVAPDADVKIFLTADEQVRAQRRGAEVAGGSVDDAVLTATSEAMRRRDAADSARTASPLTRAPDATVVDATNLDVQAVVSRIVDMAKEVARHGRAS